ncbi:MAG: RNA polymerase sigma factor, partial [Actinomycetota bacterium]
MESLEELARRAAKGDREAFGNIYQALLDKVFGYFFWNLPSQEEAEDLTEEVFLRCLVHIRDYDPRKGSFRAWIFRIARNLLVDHLRRASVRKGSVGAVWEETEVSQDDRLEDEEGRRMVREALEELPETQRQVVIMKYFAGMDNAEVARALGRSEGAVNALQHRALRR